MSFLDTGAQQLTALLLYDQIENLLSRLDCQDFFETWLEAHGL